MNTRWLPVSQEPIIPIPCYTQCPPVKCHTDDRKFSCFPTQSRTSLRMWLLRPPLRLFVHVFQNQYLRSRPCPPCKQCWWWLGLCRSGFAPGEQLDWPSWRCEILKIQCCFMFVCKSFFLFLSAVLFGKLGCFLLKLSRCSFFLYCRRWFGVLDFC